jgi:phage tail-like protein
MRLTNLTARSHIDGNRIDLTWTVPELPTEVRVVRGSGTHPDRIDDGVVVSEVSAGSAVDRALHGETVYYYSLFTKSSGELEWMLDPHNRVSELATARYDFGGQMFAMLPTIYRRYDVTTTHADVAEADREKGFLRRFLDLVGGELDQLYSLARVAADLHDLERVDGRLLPVLAQWIGWQTDYGAAVQAQRREIRHAPLIYERIGTLEALNATARRVSGLQFQAKEFVHNVARTNEPERLNLWSTMRIDPESDWSAPELVSVNYSFGGRANHVPLDDGELFVFHTRRRHGTPDQDGVPGWSMTGDTAAQSMDIWAKKRTAQGHWEPSGPLVGRTVDDKQPTAVEFAGMSWLFWETYNPQEPAPQRRRRIAFMTRPVDGNAWSEIAVSGQPGTAFLGDGDAERRQPVAVVDGTGLWLFWQERSGDRWDIRYNRQDGADPAKWQLTTPKTLRQQEELRIHDDLFVLTRPGPDRRLWLFGACRVGQAASGQRRWKLTYRVKNGLDPNVEDWADAQPVPSVDGAHDREPAPVLAPAGGIELFFSTTRPASSAEPADGSWSVFRAALSDPGSTAWGPAELVASASGSQRAPLAVRTNGTTLVVYRSSQPVTHSRANGDTTIDNRYVGTLTFRGVRPVSYGAFDDVQTYTVTTPGHGRREDGRIARDAVGLFPVNTDARGSREQTSAAIARLKTVAPEFLPINARAIFIEDQ